jgi:aerobic-type carbon monoxide dehydrogenase small subunit (CoxS/CutS family)
VNCCLVLAITADGKQITTIEGLGTSSDLHPMQQVFVAQDALQCGYCTPGQVCSAVAMLEEVQQGWPSAVTADVADVLQHAFGYLRQVDQHYGDRVEEGVRTRPGLTIAEARSAITGRSEDICATRGAAA